MPDFVPLHYFEALRGGPADFVWGIIDFVLHVLTSF
jgi:hypothetical protein